MPVSPANGIDVHYLRREGEGCPVVLLHGLTGIGACWTPVARALDDAFDVVMPDARGHGDSSAPAYGYRYDQLADDVVGVIQRLGLSRPVLVGHSMGGLTAAVVASRGGGLLRGLVLADPTFLSPERQREVHQSDVAEQHRKALAGTQTELIAQARARHPRRSQELISLQAEAKLKTTVDAFEILRPPNPDYRELVRAISVPTLLVVGDSTVVTLEMADELRTANPHVEVAQVKEAWHGLPFDHPEQLAELINGFARRLC